MPPRELARHFAVQKRAPERLEVDSLVDPLKEGVHGYAGVFSATPRRKSRYFTKTAPSRTSVSSSSSGRGGGPAKTAPVLISNCPRWQGQMKLLPSLASM